MFEDVAQTQHMKQNPLFVGSFGIEKCNRRFDSVSSHLFRSTELERK